MQRISDSLPQLPIDVSQSVIGWSRGLAAEKKRLARLPATRCDCNFGFVKYVIAIPPVTHALTSITTNS
ncbi:MAG TPA: hypothetical protein VIT22_05900 [Pseudoxanthomonas sp.]